MLKKIKNKNGSALTTAILIMIVVATIGIITSLILSSNVRITLKRVNERMEIVRVENEMYNILSSYSALPLEKSEKRNINNKTYNLEIKTETVDENSTEGTFIFLISFENECIVECKVKFENNENGEYYYDIQSWSV